MGMAIGILSGKGGVGKTTVVANLGAVLTNVFNKNVVILDSNIATSHLGLHLGLYEDLPVTLREVIKRKTPLSYAIYIHPTTGIRVIPAPLSGDDINLSRKKLGEIIDKLKKDYELVLVDCAPGLGREVVTAVTNIDAGIIVTTPDFPAVADALKSVELLKLFKKSILGIVINRYSNKKYELTIQEIASVTGVDVIATIPYDDRVLESVAKGVPVTLLFSGSRASQSLTQLGASVIGEEYKPPGLLSAVKEMFGIFRVPTTPNLQRKAFLQIKQKEYDLGIQEKSDVEELKSQLTAQVKGELKREILERVKERMKEK